MRTKQKTELCQFCLKLNKSRCMPAKRDRKLPVQGVQGMVSSRMRSKRNQNEITICSTWGHDGTRQGRIPKHTRIYLVGVSEALKHLKNEIHAWKTRSAYILVINLRRRSHVLPSCQKECALAANVQPFLFKNIPLKTSTTCIVSLRHDPLKGWNQKQCTSS